MRNIQQREIFQRFPSDMAQTQVQKEQYNVYAVRQLHSP